MNIQDFSSEILQVDIDKIEIKKEVEEIQRDANKLEGSQKISWLLDAITFIDLTSLGADDTPKKIQELCEKAVNPLEPPFVFTNPLHTAAICVYPLRLPDAVSAMDILDPTHKVSIASVAGGFPSGQYPLETRLREVELAIEGGAVEIDIVVNRTMVLMQQWHQLYEELRSFRIACGNNVCLKTILATGELGDLKNVYAASMIAMMAGTDFIKTSTGKEVVNATLPVGIIMCKAIKDYYNWTERMVGLKPAGGIKTAQEALEWMYLVKTKLGSKWLTKRLFRIGASSLLDNITAELPKK